jgi:hypothetical protein
MKFSYVSFLALAFTFLGFESLAQAQEAPDPVRPVTLRPVGKSRVFTLPDPGQTQVDLSADLDTLFSTELVNNSHLKPVNVAGAPSPAPVANPDCSQHLELEADLSALSLSNQDYKVTIGYNSSGAINPGNALSATGTVDFKVGAIRMDFHLFSCNSSETCTEVLASASGSDLSGVSTDVQINFGLLGAGFSLMWNTDLNKIISKVMDLGVQALVSSSDFENLLPWQAQVYEVDPSGTIFFNAGNTALVGANQAFTVLEPVPGMAGGCPIYKSVAEIHTVHVEDSSAAVVDSWFDGAQTRGIHTGDTVMVREVK